MVRNRISCLITLTGDVPTSYHMCIYIYIYTLNRLVLASYSYRRVIFERLVSSQTMQWFLRQSLRRFVYDIARKNSNWGSQIPESLLMFTSTCSLKAQISQGLGTFLQIGLPKTGHPFGSFGTCVLVCSQCMYVLVWYVCIDR